MTLTQLDQYRESLTVQYLALRQVDMRADSMDPDPALTAELRSLDCQIRRVSAEIAARTKPRKRRFSWLWPTAA